MNSASLSAFREAGALGDLEYDEEPPNPNERLHCSRCGAFVSAKTHTTETYPEEPPYEFDDGMLAPGRPAAEVVTFPCKRCGGGHVEEYWL